MKRLAEAATIRDGARVVDRTLGRIAEHKINRIDDLLPWRYAPRQRDRQAIPSPRAATPDAHHTSSPRSGALPVSSTALPAAMGQESLRRRAAETMFANFITERTKHHLKLTYRRAGRLFLVSTIWMIAFISSPIESAPTTSDAISSIKN